MTSRFSVGQKVTVSNRNVPTRVQHVARMTKTKMVLRDGSEWRVNGSREFKRASGYNYCFYDVQPWLPEHSERIRCHNMLVSIRDFSGWAKLSLGQVQAVFDIIRTVDDEVKP